MKLFTLHEEAEPFQQSVLRKVFRKINSGDSRLKSFLKGGGYTLQHVQHAIKQGECLSSHRSDIKSLGPTYLEQTVSNILRDLVTDNQIALHQLNDARKIFGLEMLTAKGLKKEKKRVSNQRYGKVEGGKVQT